MLLGLGSGMGLIYWHQKGMIPFLGGRDHLLGFVRGGKYEANPLNRLNG
jgi:hypothetical protein